MSDRAPASPPRFEDLKRRFGAAVVLIGLAGASAFMGGGVFNAFIALAMAISAAELTRLVHAETELTPLARAVMIVGAPLVIVVSSVWERSGLWLVLGLLAVLLAANALRFGPRTFLGLAALVLAGLAALALRAQEPWLFLIIIVAVAGVDIGGYFFGKTFGGPKLWPAVSPKKTWAGALGGLAVAIVITMTGTLLLGGNAFSAFSLGLVITVVAIAGDVTESAMKRRYGVKDTGTIMPGHGGLLDRFDGLTAVLCLLWFFDGAYGLAPAMGVL